MAADRLRLRAAGAGREAKINVAGAAEAAP